MTSRSESNNEFIYVILATLFCVVAILANVVTVKLVPSLIFNALPIPAGLIIYPFTFFISNLVTELFGSAKARQMVWLSFAMASVAYLIFSLVIALPAYDPEMQVSFERIFSLNGIMLASSLIAYLTSQTVDIRLYTAIKKWTGNNKMWIRLICASLVAQLIDAFIVGFVQLYIGLQLNFFVVLNIILISYVYKAVVSIVFTPLFYVAVSGTKWLSKRAQTL